MFPINLDLGPFHYHNYEGIYFIAALLLSLLHFSLIAKKENLDNSIYYMVAFYSLIVAIGSARLFSFILINTKPFFQNPLILFSFNIGGMTMTGSMLCALLTALILMKIKKLDFIYNIQYVIRPIILGQIIGRIGCFLNGDGSGVPTALPWGIVYNSKSIAYRYITPGTPLHPTQLYEIFGNIILLSFLIITQKNDWIKKRSLIWFTLWYSALRFINDFFRNDTNRLDFFPILTTSQFLYIFSFIIGVVLLLWSIIYNDKLTPDDENIAKIID